MYDPASDEDFRGQAVRGMRHAIREVAGPTWTLLPEDMGVTIAAMGEGLVVTVPRDLPAGFNCRFVDLGTGRISFVMGTGTVNRLGATSSPAYGSVLAIACLRNTGGGAAEVAIINESNTNAFPGIVAGRYYPPATILVSTTATAVAANVAYYAPFLMPGAIINRIGLEVTVLAAGACRLALYANKGGVPGELILDCGTVDTGAVATVEATIADTVLPDICWAMALFNATPTCRNGSPARGDLIGANSASVGVRGYSATQTYGVAPASASVVSLGGSGAVPGMFVRKV
jgi:hypothetical protein